MLLGELDQPSDIGCGSGTAQPDSGLAESLGDADLVGEVGCLALDGDRGRGDEVTSELAVAGRLVISSGAMSWAARRVR